MFYYLLVFGNVEERIAVEDVLPVEESGLGSQMMFGGGVLTWVVRRVKSSEHWNRRQKLSASRVNTETEDKTCLQVE